MSADVGKKPPSGPANWSHWKRPNTRIYHYNFEYGESYYQPQVRYLASISSSTESTNISSSSTSYRSSARSSSRSVTSRSLRARSTPPPAQSFIERWTSDPFYGRYGPAPSWRRTESSSSLSAQERASSVSRSIRAASETRESSRLEQSSSISRSVRASSETRVAQLQSSKLSSSESNIYSASSQRKSAAISSSTISVASLRQRALACASSLEEISALSSSTRSNIKEALARAKETQALVSVYDAYARDYPRQHVVCETSCPLHNDPNFQRRFVLGNRYLDAAALGGFDVLYDPTASTKLIKKLRSVNETETEEVYAERSSSVESSRLRARYQEASW